MQELLVTEEMELQAGNWSWSNFSHTCEGGFIGGGIAGMAAGAPAGGVGAIPGAIGGALVGTVIGAVGYSLFGWE